MTSSRQTSFPPEFGFHAGVAPAWNTGEQEDLVPLATLAEVQTAARRIAGGAQRLLSICTADLEPAVYDEPAFLEILKRFVLGRRFAKVRVLVHEPLRLIGNQNRFVAMSRRLSSHIEIRTALPAYRGNRCAMLIADTDAILYRPRADGWEGVAGFRAQRATRLYLQEFDTMWVGSEPGENARRFAR